LLVYCTTFATNCQEFFTNPLNWRTGVPNRLWSRFSAYTLYVPTQSRLFLLRFKKPFSFSASSGRCVHFGEFPKFYTPARRTCEASAKLSWGNPKPPLSRVYARLLFLFTPPSTHRGREFFQEYHLSLMISLIR